MFFGSKMRANFCFIILQISLDLSPSGYTPPSGTIDIGNGYIVGRDAVISRFSIPWRKHYNQVNWYL